MSSRRGELAIVACRNGIDSANTIRSHLEKLCQERNTNLARIENPKTYEQREKHFIDYVHNEGIRVTETTVKDFKDGEILPTINESVREKDVYIVQNPFQSDSDNVAMTSHNLIELFLTIDAAKRADASHVSVIMPYMIYSKQERRQGRQSASAKMILDIFEQLDVEKLVTMDLHAPAIQSFTSNMKIENLFGSSMILDYLMDDLHFNGVFAAPDANAAKNVRFYTKATGLPMIFGDKFRRPDSQHDVDEEYKILGEEIVAGRDVAIVDDQIATGGTMLKMAQMIKKAGSKNIYAVTTHGLMLANSEESFRRAVSEGYIKNIIMTNTIIHSQDFYLRNPHVSVIDALKMFASTIFELQTGGSISGLYSVKLRKAIYGDNHRTMKD